MTSIKYSLTEMKKIAKRRGGLCLSKKFISSRQILIWQCKKGHVWRAIPSSVVNRQSWCPTCNGYSDKNDLSLMRKIAVDRGGLCLSKVFKSAKTKMKWQCDNGHVWLATPSGIKRGYWCPTCNHSGFTKESISDFAKKQKGVFASKKWKGYRHKHEWKCNKGHSFVASYENLKRRNYFCPTCRQDLLKQLALVF